MFNILLFAALLFFVGCNNLYDDCAISREQGERLGVVNLAIEDDATRTFVQDNTTLCWHTDDRLSIFYGNTANVEYRFDGEDGDVRGTASPVGTPSSGSSLTRIYALYPYSLDNTMSADGVVGIELPAVQYYAQNSFGQGSNSMVAATKSVDDNSLSFMNVCGYLKLKLYGDATIKSITLRGNRGEKIAGAATIDVSYDDVPRLTMSDDATTEIVLDCGSGVKLGAKASNATHFWIVVPAMTFEQGFTVCATDSDGGVYEHSTTRSVKIERNIIQPMSPFEVVFPEPMPEDNQIWYTTSNGVAVSFDSSDFSSAVVSNNYANGQGVITFESVVTRVGNNAFKNNATLKTMTLPQTVTSIGNYAFSGCSKLTNILLPEGLTTLGTRAFESCTAFDVLTLPSTITTFGGYSFYHAEANELVLNCSIPDADASLNPETMAFTETYFEKVTFTGRVKRIGDYSFGWNNYIEEINLDYGVEQIGEGAFCANSALYRVILPETIKSIGTLAFYGCSNIAALTCCATAVPQLGEQAFPSSVLIYVPDASVMAYKSDSEWGKYSIYNLDGEEYASTDYSADGEVVVVQKAERGNGIDIIMMGDGYSDRQIAAGYYMDDLTRAADMLFTEEPYKSFRDLFNIYVVKCVSRREGVTATRDYGRTAFNCYFDDYSTQIKGDEWVPYDYADKAISEERQKEMMVIVILNSANYGGTCYMIEPETNPDDSNCWGNGCSISYFSLCGDDDILRKLILHEAGGHGFAKLADEYFSSGSGSVSFGDYYDGKYFEGYGWYRNIDYVYEEGDYIDATNVKWHYFLEDERYQYDGLGVFEGAYTYATGAYRPTDISIMRHNEGGFNAPSREAIYIRMHKLAYGNDWVYDYEDFVAYDAINRKTAPQAASLSSLVYDEQLPHTSPVVVR